MLEQQHKTAETNKQEISETEPQRKVLRMRNTINGLRVSLEYIRSTQKANLSVRHLEFC